MGIVPLSILCWISSAVPRNAPSPLWDVFVLVSNKLSLYLSANTFLPCLDDTAGVNCNKLRNAEELVEALDTSTRSLTGYTSLLPRAVVLGSKHTS